MGVISRNGNNLFGIAKNSVAFLEISHRLRIVMPIPTTIYLPEDLKDRARVIARRRGRKLSPQVVRWVERIVDRIEKSEGASHVNSRRSRTCRA